jgi:hypothetical protein
MAGSPQVAFLRKCLVLSTWASIPIPRVCIETGTYRGEGTLALLEIFPTVHTIELSAKWHQYSSEKLAPHKGITCHLGDSAEVLEKLLPQLAEPAAFFLDAHFAGGDTAHGTDEVPLLRELEAIGKRQQPDLIIVDDMRLIGKKGECGADGHPLYPAMTFDWREITMDRIASVVNRDNRTFWVSGDDRILIFRNLSATQVLRARMAAIPIAPIIKTTEFRRKVRSRLGRYWRSLTKAT